MVLLDLSYPSLAHLFILEKKMDKEQRIKNFQNWINEGNELTVDDMLAVIIGCMHNDEAKEFNTFLMLAGKIYDINIKCRSFAQ